MTNSYQPNSSLWSMSTTAQASSKASFTTRDGKVTLRVEAPGYTAAGTTVEVMQKDLDRVVEIAHKQGYDRTSMKVRLPQGVGAPAGPARVRDGIVTLSFHRNPDTPSQRVDVEG